MRGAADSLALMAATDNSKRIAEIDEILRSGARSVSTDGLSVSYDFDTLREERRQLMEADTANRSRRPIASNINLSGF